MTARAQSAEECLATAQKADAIQLWYVNGVPHTDANGNRLMNYTPGKSFFPIGLFAPPNLPEGDEDWRELKGLKVNTMWMNCAPAGLEAADRYGLQVIYNGWRTASDREFLPQIANHKRLLGVCWKDEPIGSLNVPGQMEKWLREFVEFKKVGNKILPGTVLLNTATAWITPPATEWAAKWGMAGDVVCCATFPITCANTQTIAQVPNAIPQATAFHVLISAQKKPVWVVIGTFEERRRGAAEEDPVPFRFCTPAQLRSQVYTAIIHGATGVHYFAWDGLVSRCLGVLGMSPNPRTVEKGNHELTMSPMQQASSVALWKAASAINGEIQDLVPAILSPTVDPKDIHYRVDAKGPYACKEGPYVGIPYGKNTVANPVRTLLKTVPNSDELLLLTANMENSQYVVDIKFDRPIQNMDVMFHSLSLGPTFGSNPVYTKDSTGVTLRYDPFDVHVIKIKLRSLTRQPSRGHQEWGISPHASASD
jgi:hypothetical protein